MISQAERFRFPIRWGDVDSAGVIFYANYFRLLEATEDEFFRHHGRPVHELQKEFGMWNPRVETHATFFHPARFGETVEIELRVAELRRSSVRYEYEITRVDPEPIVLLARTYNVVVCVSQENFRAFPIPQPMREILERSRMKPAGPGSR